MATESPPTDKAMAAIKEFLGPHCREITYVAYAKLLDQFANARVKEALDGPEPVFVVRSNPRRGGKTTELVLKAVRHEREACARTVEKSYRLLSTEELDNQTPAQARRHGAALIRARQDGQ